MSDPPQIRHSRLISLSIYIDMHVIETMCLLPPPFCYSRRSLSFPGAFFVRLLFIVMIILTLLPTPVHLVVVLIVVPVTVVMWWYPASLCFCVFAFSTRITLVFINLLPSANVCTIPPTIIIGLGL